jgi:peptide/nickel transport system permease protein
VANLKRIFNDLRGYPSAMAGGIIIIGFLIVAVYALIAIPYDDAVRLWRGGENVWYNTPRNAPPIWTNWFTERDQPQTITLNSALGEGEKTVTQNGDITDVTILYSFDYPYSGFPQEMSVFVTAKYVEKVPFISMAWTTPDGREIRLGDVTPQGSSASFALARMTG